LKKARARFAERVHAILDQQGDLKAVIEPLLAARRALSHNLKALDDEVVQRARQSPECRLLMTVPGVGPVTALAYLATIETPERFTSSRSVGAYAGLTTRRNQSGEMDWSGRISKHGDSMLRALLYEAANAMLSVVKKAHPLKDWARRVRKRSSHKKACVALARKLAVIMHAMLKTGKAFRWPAKANSTEATNMAH
jgi:transposase